MSASERVVVNELSSSLLDMKFMLKKKKQLEAKAAKKAEAKLDEKIKQEEGTSQPTLETPAKTGANVEICMDLAKLENLRFGRLSFGGFNKDVESLMVYHEKLRNGELSDSDEDDEKDVNDAEMAKSFGGQKLAALSKKAQTKRERAQLNEQNQESTGRRFNFKDIRKRFASGDADGQPERKFMKPADD